MATAHRWQDTIRYSQLRKVIPQVSERVLVAQLRELEKDKLVSRIVHPEVPPRVEYELTELGNSMRPMLESISQWGNLHRLAAEDAEVKQPV